MNETISKKCRDFLLPGEEVIDCLRIRAYHRKSELVLTDLRLLVSGATGALGPGFSLLRGNMVAALFLPELESFILGTGRRTWLLFLSVALAAAGAVMAGGGIWMSGLSLFPAEAALFAAAALSFFAWVLWPRAFVVITGKGMKVSGAAKIGEARVFLEELQLASLAAREGKTRQEVKSAVLSGLPEKAEARKPESGSEQPPLPSDESFCAGSGKS